LVRKLEGKRPLGRTKQRWEDNIRMDLGAIGCGVVDWIHVAQDRDQWWALVNSDEPLDSIKGHHLLWDFLTS
jgi:hypothetical protein